MCSSDWKTHWVKSMSDILILSLLCRNRIRSFFSISLRAEKRRFPVLSFQTRKREKMESKLGLDNFEPSGKIEITVEGKSYLMTIYYHHCVLRGTHDRPSRRFGWANLPEIIVWIGLLQARDWFWEDFSGPGCSCLFIVHRQNSLVFQLRSIIYRSIFPISVTL